MENIYLEEDLIREKRQKKMFLIYWLIGLGVYLAIVATFITIYLIVDYDSPMLLLCKIMLIVITSLFGIATLFFFALPYRKQRAYTKLLVHLKEGIKETREGEVLRYDDAVQVKDGVEFKSLTTKEYNELRKIDMERKILLDLQKPMPIFEVGEKVEYLTQGNVLVSFEKKKNI